MITAEDESLRQVLTEAYLGDKCSRSLADALQERVQDLQAKGIPLETDTVLTVLHRRLYTAVFAYHLGKPLRASDFEDQMH